MTFAEIRTEVLARGSDYLNADAAGVTRVKRFVNTAYLEIVDMEHWPFREAKAIGTAPLAVADLGDIESVRVTNESNRRLDSLERRSNDGDLTTTGSPSSYYVTSGTVVTTYPIGGTLQVSHWKVPAELSADGDTPILPARFHYLIVEGAMRKVYLDADNFEGATAVKQELEGGVELMRRSLGVAESGRILVLEAGW